MQNKKTQSFTDLIVWQKAHVFVLSIYKITKSFPKDELFGLVSQMRRAAVSITSNIAEGFVRQSKKEKVQFYFVALGFVMEIENQLLIARDLKFLSKEVFSKLAQEVIVVAKLLNGLISSINNS